MVGNDSVAKMINFSEKLGLKYVIYFDIFYEKVNVPLKRQRVIGFSYFNAFYLR